MEVRRRRRRALVVGVRVGGRWSGGGVGARWWRMRVDRGWVVGVGGECGGWVDGRVVEAACGGGGGVDGGVGGRGAAGGVGGVGDVGGGRGVGRRVVERVVGASGGGGEDGDVGGGDVGWWVASRAGDRRVGDVGGWRDVERANGGRRWGAADEAWSVEDG